MTAMLWWFRLDSRRRWRSLLVLALLVAFAAGTVMTAVAGARRGAGVVERLVAETAPADVAIVPNQPGFDWDAVRALPRVEALTVFGGGALAVDGIPEDSLDNIAADDEAMRTIERPVVLDGRLADPARPDEVMVTPYFTDTYGLGIGDSVTIRLFEPESSDRALLDPTVEPDGPVVEARIVGVARSFWFGDNLDGEGRVLFSPGLFTEYGPNLGATSQLAYFNAIARLDGGEAAIPAFQADLARVAGRADIDVWNMAEQFYRHYEKVTGFEANALLLFALAAGIAAVFLVGQSIARYAATAAADLQILQAVGLRPVEARSAAAVGPTLAAFGGVVLGAAGSVMASRWFPIGSAALAEPDPGVDVDAVVLTAGLVAVPTLVAAGAVGAAWFALRPSQSARSARGSAAAGVAASAGLPVPLIVGTRFALEPGRGRQAVPVRPALIGAVTGVLGVLAALTFSSGVDDAATRLARFGQTHQLATFFGLNGEDFVPADDVLPLIAADPDVVAVNDARSAVAEAGDVPVTVYSFDPVGGAVDVVVTGGRMPERADEVVLAPETADAMSVGVGDTIELTGAGRAHEFTVTGTAFVPDGSHNDYATGAWATESGYAALFTTGGRIGFKFHSGYVALRPGVDPAAVTARIAETTAPVLADSAIAAGADPAEVAGIPGIELWPPEPPDVVAELQQIRTLPVFLAGFLAVLALGAVGHALATAVRRRRHDVAVLRAVGMTRRQSRGVVVTQATVLALAGLVVGVPLGVALGRSLWRYVAETTPLFYVTPVAEGALALTVLVALVAANLLAAWPSHRAASMRISHVLRAE